MDSINILVTLIGSLLASTGFWTYLTKHVGNNGVNKKQNNMLIGLAHDRIIELGIKYLERDSQGRAIVDITNPPIIENVDYFR